MQQISLGELHHTFYIPLPPSPTTKLTNILENKKKIKNQPTLSTNASSSWHHIELGREKMEAYQIN